MHVFHIKGFSGFLMFLLATISAIVVLIGIPSAFMMVLWNAVVFEGFGGPEFNYVQGMLLFGLSFCTFMAIFRPEVQLEFKNAADPDIENRFKGWNKKDDE